MFPPQWMASISRVGWRTWGFRPRPRSGQLPGLPRGLEDLGCPLCSGRGGGGEPRGVSALLQPPAQSTLCRLCCLGQWPAQPPHTLEQLAGDLPGGGWTSLSQPGHTCHSSWFKIPKFCKPALLPPARESGVLTVGLSCAELAAGDCGQAGRRGEWLPKMPRAAGRPGCVDPGPLVGRRVPTGVKQDRLQTHFSAKGVAEMFTHVSPPGCPGSEGGGVGV